VGAVLDEHLGDPDVARQDMTLDGVLGADAWARTRASQLVEKR
jgi:1-deoxy-D-xylulose-5-phosphate reductoisomerase